MTSELTGIRYCSVCGEDREQVDGDCGDNGWDCIGYIKSCLCEE